MLRKRADFTKASANSVQALVASSVIHVKNARMENTVSGAPDTIHQPNIQSFDFP